MSGVADQPSYLCAHCGAVSYNPNDLIEEYCGRCHRYARDPAMVAELVVAEMGRLDELGRIRRGIEILKRAERRLIEAHELAPVRVFSD